MVPFLTALAALSLLIWVYLIAAHGGYWRARERLPATLPALTVWPAVVAVVPARNEAAVIGPAIASLLAQDYPGRLDVVLVDDHSSDDTAPLATEAAKHSGRAAALTVLPARPLPAGWSGKLWALSEGARHVAAQRPEAEFLWLSDADIAHTPDNLRRLVAKAEVERRDLVSLMVTLSCRGFWEHLLIPPFVYFFQMLYPFAWANAPGKRTAAAAGGCVLLRRAALESRGGFAAIKSEIIDDCALARLIKHGPPPGGRIWIGLASTARSLRPYQGLGEIWRMVARSAYTQLRHAPALLVGTLVAMCVTFLAPPLLVLTAPLHGGAAAALAGLAAWSLMTVSAWPTFALYRQPVWLAALLPVAAALYCAMTVDSAWRHWRGRGGAWKGRVHPAPVAAARPVAKRRPKRQTSAAEPLRALRDPSEPIETPSGKGAGDENFPVGSWLLPARLRPHVAVFYRFARAIDDIADNPALAPADKIARLSRFEAALLGGAGTDPALPTAIRMRDSLAETGVSTRHCLDLVAAFKQDATKLRYRDWADLLGYCELSANPVGRYLLDLHGEPSTGYPASDGLCSALQVLNHLQDCQDDRRTMDRVYVPLDWLSEAGIDVAAIDAPRSSPAFRRVLDRCLDGVDDLLTVARDLPAQLTSRHLAMESAVILRLAERLTALLRAGDPLAGRVGLRRRDFAACGLRGAGGELWCRLFGSARHGR